MTEHLARDVDDRCRQASPEVVEAILQLARLDYMKSISLPFTNCELWSGLVAIQIGRAKSMDLQPMNAMPLIATGGAIPGFHEGNCRLDIEMGGIVSVHNDDVVFPADVYALPNGLGLSFETAPNAANISQAVFDPWYREKNSFCKCFLTLQHEIGEIAGSTRTVIKDWVLYKANDPNYIEALRIRLPWNE